MNPDQEQGEQCEGSLPWGASIAPRPCIRLGLHGTLTMKQSMASAARLRGGGPILSTALEPWSCSGHRHLESLRLGLPRQATRRATTLSRVQVVGRSVTPTGMSPMVTMRQSAISSLRASATIIVVLRAPFGPSVRARYHCASALPLWNLKNRQASWISPRRARGLPALANPFSRRLLPLSSGEPVRPT